MNAQLVESDARKLLLGRSGTHTKVEPSIVIRGSTVPPVSRRPQARPRGRTISAYSAGTNSSVIAVPTMTPPIST